MSSELAPQQREDSLSSNCIGELEHHIHKVFASIRIPGEDFVYNSNNELFTLIDDYVSEQVTESKPPLLILSEPGLGKSALLSNWLDRRARNLQRMRSTTDEFVFWHAVGCSRQSTNVNNLIRRLVIDLKNRFSVQRDIPVHTDRLSWELPRFLDLAAKKGKIIIVIDGVTGLMSDDNNEANLAWLPLEFPPNVRFVLSATIPAEGTMFDSRVPAHPSPGANAVADSFKEYAGNTASNAAAVDPALNVKKGRILQELERRKWLLLRLHSLDKLQCKQLITSYIQKTVQSEVSQMATGVYLTAIAGTTYASKETLPGFLLFDCHIHALLAHPHGRNPLFLRLFLRAAHLVCSRGFSLWHIWDDWLQAESIHGLYTRVLETLEVGYTKTTAVQAQALERISKEGGYAALRRQYPWHPAFQTRPEESNETLAAVEYAAVSVDKAGNQQNRGGQALSNSVLQSLGDQHWLSAADQAEAKFEAARKKTERMVHDTVVKATREAHSRPNVRIMEAVCNGVATPHATRHSEETSLAAIAGTTINSLGGEIDDIDGENGSSDEEEGGTIEEGDEEEEEEDDDNRSRAASSADQIHQKSDTTESKDGRPSQLMIGTSTKSRPSTSSRASTINSYQAGVVPLDKREEIGGGTLTALLHRASSIKSMSGKRSVRGSAYNSQKDPNLMDPSESIDLLPIYLRGGMSVPGLGSLLGNALALLYVSRHGLKEHEIWAILASLSEAAQGHGLVSRQPKTNGSPPSRAGTAVDVAKRPKTEQSAQRVLINIVHEERGAIHDIWRTEDPIAASMITVSALLKGFKKVLPRMGRNELNKILELTNLTGNHVPGGVFPNEPGDFVSNLGLGDQMKVNYEELIRRIAHLYNLGRKSDVKLKLTPKITLSTGGVDRLDNFVVEDRWAEGKSGGDHGWDDFTIGSEMKKSIADELSLGPVIEESLLVVLCALGSLHSPENQVLLLPVDSDLFREVVFDRYVLQRGGDSAWHDHLIKYFQREANCMRRCEELPWHLQLCRKWNTLKDTLCDLKTFELMYGSDLKDELMQYWLTLSEGPLYVTDTAAKAAATVAAMKPASARTRRGPQPLLKGDYGEKQRILSELDSAAALGLSEKEARAQLMKDKIAPFDVVTEFNRSVENWMYQTHPTAQQTHHIVSQIAKFLADFSRHITIIPSFLRLGIDLKPLTQFGITFDELKSHADIFQKSKDLEEEKEDSKRTLVDEANAFPTPKMIASMHLYPYLRWIWIQFPWLSLPFAANVGRIAREEKQSVAVSAPVHNTGHVPSTPAMNDHTFLTEGGDLENDPAAVRATSASIAKYWEVLKQDPKQEILHFSDSQKLSVIKSATVKSQSNLHILENNAHNLHLLDCRLFGGKPGHPDYSRLSSAKYRRPMEDEIAATKGIPFSEHCTRSLRLNTLFPSVELMTKQANAKVEVEDMKLFDKAKKVEMWGGKMAIFHNDLNVDLKKSLETERLQNFNQLYAGIFPLSDLDAEIERESNRMGKMRNYLDKAVQMRRERKAFLHSLQRQINSREQDDVVAEATVAAGEMAIEAANNRLTELNAALDEALLVEVGYQKILDLMAKCPPFLDHHLAEVEQNLALARQQLADLIAYRRNIYMEAEKARTLKKHQLKSKIEYYADARMKVAQKRRAFLAEHGIIEEGKTSRSDSFSYGSEEHSLVNQSRSRSTAGGKLRDRLNKHLLEAAKTNLRSPGGPSGRDKKSMITVGTSRPTLINETGHGPTVQVPTTPSAHPPPFSPTADSPVLASQSKPTENLSVSVAETVVSSVYDAFKRASGHITLSDSSIPNPRLRSPSPPGSGGSPPMKSIDEGGNDSASERESDDGVEFSGPEKLAKAMERVAKEKGPNKDTKEEQIKARWRAAAAKRQKPVVYQYDKDSLLQRALTAFDKKNVRDFTNKHARERQAQLHLSYIVEQTGSMNEDEFLERFHAAQKMTESLKAMQSLVDSKLAQLRAEHSELYGSWGESKYEPEEQKLNGGVLVEDKSPPTSSPKKASPDILRSPKARGAPADVVKPEEPVNDTRYFDTKMSKTEMHLNRVHKSLDKALKTINDVRTGTAHLMELLVVNAKLLQGLPKSTTPKLDSDEDIVRCLSWMEERILGINEAIMLESGKPTGGTTDDSKSLPARQTELAQLVENMIKTAGTNDPKSAKKKKGGRKAGDMSRELINPMDNGNTVSNSKSIVVKSGFEAEKFYESEMRKLEQTRDKEAQREERRERSKVGLDPENGLERFLSEALSTDESQGLLRQANMLTNSKQGANAGFGWALENMLKVEGAGVIANGSLSPDKKSKRPKSPGISQRVGDGNLSDSPVKQTRRGSDGRALASSMSPADRRPMTAHPATMSDDGLPDDGRSRERRPTTGLGSRSPSLRKSVVVNRSPARSRTSSTADQ